MMIMVFHSDPSHGPRHCWEEELRRYFTATATSACQHGIAIPRDYSLLQFFMLFFGTRPVFFCSAGCHEISALHLLVFEFVHLTSVENIHTFQGICVPFSFELKASIFMEIVWIFSFLLLMKYFKQKMWKIIIYWNKQCCSGFFIPNYKLVTIPSYSCHNN